MSVWILCVLLPSLIGLTQQNGHTNPLKDVKVSAEKTDTSDFGAWVLKVEWIDENYENEKVTYDVEVLYTEQMTTVHFETIHFKANITNHYHWKWTSPIPLQCTSHSVRIRRRDRNRTGEWTQFYEYTGKDQNPTQSFIYPQEQAFMVGSNITFCCILESKNSSLSKSSHPQFPIRISNRTYITNPIDFHSPSDCSTSDVVCNITGKAVGSSVFIGYPPDDQNLTCVTRNLISVECHWTFVQETYLCGDKETVYTLNGRKCKFNQCELSELKKQETKWTLIAENPLGVKIITDTANPLHRVWLRAPSDISHAAKARNVTLRWRWDMKSYTSFPMICQVMVNENIYNETFSGQGLKSIVLADLQPFSSYTAKVRCGSDKHFYKWGDWSEITEFKTKEDIPEAVDVWIQHSEQNTYVLWKPLLPQQSHGVIKEYKITMNNNSTHIKEINKQSCYEISSGNGKSDQIISVSAMNSAGFSPSSTINVAVDSGWTVNVSRINSSNGGFELFWEKYPLSTCGYVVEWFPTFRKTQCDVEWKKIPECDSDVCEIQIPPGFFAPGEKYTISVYACVDDAPVLLQRREGYAVEQRPSMTVQNLMAKRNGKIVKLSWDKVPLEQQRGFIRYKVKIINSEKIINTFFTEECKVNLTLDPGSYIFNVSAVTSGGESVNAINTMVMENKIEQMIVATVVGCSAATLVFITITVLCFKKRKWLKKLFYPDIPKPTVPGKWATKGIYCTPLTERYTKCEIQKAHSLERPETPEGPQGLDPISSKASLLPAQHFYQNTSSPVYTSDYPSPWPCDKKLTSIIENPSYEMTIPEPVDVAQMSDLPLEMEDSYISVPQLTQIEKASEGYKPHSTWPTNV